MKNKNIQPILYAGLLIAGILLGQKFKPAEEDSKLDYIIELLNQNYVDTISKNFEDKIISSILQNLDPHSTFIPKKDFKIENQNMEGSFSGIGVEFQIISDTIVVVAPIFGGPSEQLGIQAGDKIITVEAEKVANVGIKNKGVINRLRGEKGSKVTIQIKRTGMKELLQFTIVRDDIPLHSIDASLILEEKIGYIKINRFSATTYKEFYIAASKLLKLGMSKLILDLRDNPGGYLNSAVKICDVFFDSGYLIVYTEGEQRKRQDLFSSRGGILKDIKLVALINEGSASASEIIAGALQDNDRAEIIGRRSFGKGLVQEEMKLDDGSAIRITTQRYFTPSGRSIQKPYTEDLTEYYLEQYKTNRDYKDSIEFKTLNGETVYGGGGITPDYIVNRDKNVDYSKVNYLIGKGFISEFSIKTSNIIKSQFKNDFSVEKQKFLNKNNIDFCFNKFKNLVSKKEQDFDFSIGEIEESYLKNIIMASIAKKIWGEKAYYLIITENDKMIKKAKNLL